MKDYLIIFSQAHLDFRIPEFQAICDIFDIEFPKNFTSESLSSSISIIRFKDAQNLIKISSRSLLIRECFEVWAFGKNYQDLFTNLDKNWAKYRPLFVGENVTYSLKLTSINKKNRDPNELRGIIRELENFADSPCCSSGIDLGSAKADLENPEIRLRIIEEYEPIEKFVAHNHQDLRERKPKNIYFANWICDGQSHLANKFDLKTRRYIGNTTMDPQLALIQANLARVTKNSLVLDPYMGTGGLLLACAHFEAFCLGAEINYKILHGIGKSARKSEGYLDKTQNVESNFRQYGISKWFLSAMLADSSPNKNVWRTSNTGGSFDVIVADPPYGLRERSIKLGIWTNRKKKRVKGHNSELQLTSNQIPPPHFPEKLKYDLSEVFLDLLNFSATHLVMGGRLAYWFPCVSEEYTSDVIPRHPSLELVANCEQKITAGYSRRLLVMKKIANQEGAGAYVPDNFHERINFRQKILGGPI